jgi:hypothetical protein
MFKKNISVSSSRPLSGKDIKKFKKDVTLQFPDITGASAYLWPTSLPIVHPCHPSVHGQPTLNAMRTLIDENFIMTVSCISSIV